MYLHLQGVTPWAWQSRNLSHSHPSSSETWQPCQVSRPAYICSLLAWWPRYLTEHICWATWSFRSLVFPSLYRPTLAQVHHVLTSIIQHSNMNKSEICQAFICINLDDYGLQPMKTQNSVSQNIWISHKTGNVGLLQSMFLYMHSVFSLGFSFLYLVFAWITASMRNGMEWIRLWPCC